MALNANALTELQTVKDDLGITVSTYDARIERLINSVSSAIDAYCRRTFARGNLVEKVAGKGTPNIMLARPPIVVVNSLDDDGSALVEGDDFEIESVGAAILKRIGTAWSWHTLGTGGISNDPIAGYERKLITVDYDGGYTTPHQVTTAVYPGPSTLPSQIEEAAIMSVVSAFHSVGDDRRIANERLMDAAIAYGARNKITGRGMGGLLVDDAVAILEPFRLVEC